MEPHYPKAEPKGGRPPMPLEPMLRVCFLQQWYALRDSPMSAVPAKKCAKMACETVRSAPLRPPLPKTGEAEVVVQTLDNLRICAFGYADVKEQYKSRGGDKEIAQLTNYHVLPNTLIANT